jgi:hypothetical protein
MLSRQLVYRPGRCSVCGERVPSAELDSRQLCLRVVAPRELTLIQCWIHRGCQPAPAMVGIFCRRLIGEVLSWYATTVESDAARAWF